ncbi:hypothetical protein EB061_10325, partial [bacterium]|nr:hypothetical protein [bacterium]
AGTAQLSGPPEDLIARLVRELRTGASPEKQEQFTRISQKIERAYEKGLFDLAEQWDNRLERWLEAKEQALDSATDDAEELNQAALAQPIEDTSTGISQKAAAIFSELKQGFIDRQAAAAQIRETALEQISPNAPANIVSGKIKKVPDEDLLKFAEEEFNRRQALVERNRRAQERRSQSAPIDFAEVDDELSRLQQRREDIGAEIGELRAEASSVPSASEIRRKRSEARRAQKELEKKIALGLDDQEAREKIKRFRDFVVAYGKETRFNVTGKVTNSDEVRKTLGDLSGKLAQLGKADSLPFLKQLQDVTRLGKSAGVALEEAARKSDERRSARRTLRAADSALAESDTPENRRAQEKAAKNLELLKTQKREARKLAKDFEKAAAGLTAQVEVRLEETAAKRKLDKLEEDLLSLTRQNVTFTITGKVQNIEQARQEFGRLLSQVDQFDEAQRAAFEPQLQQLGDLVTEGDRAKLGEIRALIDDISAKTDTERQVKVKADQAKRELDALRERLDAIAKESTFIITGQMDAGKVLSTLQEVNQLLDKTSESTSRPGAVGFFAPQVQELQSLAPAAISGDADALQRFADLSKQIMANMRQGLLDDDKLAAEQKRLDGLVASLAQLQKAARFKVT